MKVFYIGRFPPPFGGVTIKNKILFENLQKHIELNKINLDEIKRLNLKEIAKALYYLFNRNTSFIVGSASTSRRFLSWFLYTFNRPAINNSLLILMGGESARVISKDKKYLRWVTEYKQVFVETEAMKLELENADLTNVSIFPNCRERSETQIVLSENNTGEIKCVFFSLISKEKGVDRIVEAAKILNKENINYSIDLYGHIEKKYEREFFEVISNLENINYKGVFKGQNDILYNKLNEYNVLLFPTDWKHEGVPGILVESKIAALPAVVSDICYNSEIVEHNVSGLVLETNTGTALAGYLVNLNRDRALLNQLSEGALISAEDYYIDNHINKIIDLLFAKSRR